MLFDADKFSSKKITEAESDPTWDDGTAFPVSSKNDFLDGDSACFDGAAYHFSSKNLKVGDHLFSTHPIIKGEIVVASYPVTDATQKPNYDYVLTTEGNLIHTKYLSCDNSTSAQELVQDFAMPDYSSDLTSSELQKQTNTAVTSLKNDTQESITTAVSNPLPLEDSDSKSEPSTLSQHRHLAPHFQSKEIGKEQQINETVSPQSCKSSKITNPSSQPSKMLRDSSTAPIPKAIVDITLDLSSNGFTDAGTMRNGFVLAQDTLAPPSLEKEYCWLPSPGALSTGKGRPPGQTKQEAWLKKQGLIQKGEVLNPVILCEWYKIPITWLDQSEPLPAMELLENNARQQEIFSILESQRSPLEELSTSTQSPDIECTQQLITPVNFLEEKDQAHTRSETIPEKFLEETEHQEAAAQKPKRRERKGCLYKYLENKKLKSGHIVSYPRITEDHRDPDNPRHWRWGFNWEEKIDGEWKGRSIGSIPIGAIPMIESMRSRGIPLEEIISFIRKAKAKK